MKEAKIRIVFLDFDGVLNSGNYLRHKHKEAVDARPVDKTAIDESMVSDQFGAYFDPAAVEALKLLIDLTGAKIVVSSTWRFSGDCTTEWLQKMWKYRMLPGEIIGRTGDHQKVRGLEVRDWLREYVGTWDKCSEYPYVVIDDDSDMLYEQRNNFVKTDFNTGLTKLDALKASAILLR